MTLTQTATPQTSKRTTAPDAEARRAKRYRAHHWLRTWSVRAGAHSCLSAREGAGVVTIGVTAAGVAHVKGVKRCGSVWACPVCAPTIRERRAQAIDRTVTRALADGALVYFVTSTVAHKLGDPLAVTMTAQGEAWRRAFSGATVTRSTYLGQIRARDLTYGANGWHPHTHSLVVFEPGTTSSTAEAFLLERRATYLTKLADLGLVAAADSRGWDVRPVTMREDGQAALSSYLAKVDGGWGAGLELARGDLKSAKRSGVTPWELLNDAVDSGESRPTLWHEYERATLGRRLIVTGRKLAARYGVDLDPTDDELAAAAPDEAIIHEEVIPVAEWAWWLDRGGLADLLAQVVARALALPGSDPPGTG